AVIEGEKDAVEDLIDFCKQGPPGSAVEDVEVSWEKPSHRFTEFDIRR
ncbi:MAG: acylphosphatase, partial [Candidatus Aenigmarchaeota archaeon]|nr:acylphosphatase [Candidatus Aenigmarchaeota archaeon]